MPSRMGMVNLVAERLGTNLDEALALVDDLIPVGAYSTEDHEIPDEDVELWLAEIAREVS